MCSSDLTPGGGHDITHARGAHRELEDARTHDRAVHMHDRDACRLLHSPGRIVLPTRTRLGCPCVDDKCGFALGRRLNPTCWRALDENL